MWSKHVSKQVCPLWILRPKRETHDVEVGHWSHPNPGADGRTPRSSWNLFLECYNVINHGKPHKKLSHYQHNWVVTMGRNYHGYYLQWVVETIRNHFDAVYHIFFLYWKRFFTSQFRYNMLQQPYTAPLTPDRWFLQGRGPNFQLCSAVRQGLVSRMTKNGADSKRETWSVSICGTRSW